MEHAAELAIRVGRVGQAAALDFASEVRLAVADRAIQDAERLQIPGDHPRRAGSSALQTDSEN